jgi:hypothetical protein
MIDTDLLETKTTILMTHVNAKGFPKGMALSDNRLRSLHNLSKKAVDGKSSRLQEQKSLQKSALTG